MSERSERAAFDRRHAAEPIEITVLTGERTGGAGKGGKDVLWRPSAQILAHLDETGAMVEQDGLLEWLATEEQREGWIHDLQPLTQYRVRVRRAQPDPAEYAKHGMPVPDLSHRFALDAVLRRDVREPALEERRARRIAPATLATELGELVLDRSRDAFELTLDWCGQEVSVALDVDEDSVEGSETCTIALDRLRILAVDASTADAAWREAAAARLAEDAERWRQDAEDAATSAPITEASFAARLRLGELAIGPDGTATAYYDDDRMFWGHVILLEVEPDGTVADADIAG